MKCPWRPITTHYPERKGVLRSEPHDEVSFDDCYEGSCPFWKEGRAVYDGFGSLEYYTYTCTRVNGAKN